MIYYLLSTILSPLLGRAASVQDYTPLLGGESVKSLAKLSPHINDSYTYILYLESVIPFGAMPLFWTSDFWVLLYISTYLWVYFS